MSCYAGRPVRGFGGGDINELRTAKGGLSFLIPIIARRWELNTTSALRARSRADRAKRVAPFRASPRTLAGLTRIFKQLADESRLKILLALANEGEMHVSALCRILGQTQPAVSHHLTLLRMTGLVGYRRQGKHNYYRVESGLLCDLLEQFFIDLDCGGQAFQFKDFSLSYRRHRR